MDGSHRRGDVGPLILEGCEVVRARKVARRPVHGIDVEGAGGPHLTVKLGGDEPARQPQPVGIAFAKGIEAGMEVVGCAAHIEDADVVRQLGVDGLLPVDTKLVVGDVHVRHLPVGMDSRVGTSCGMESDLFTCHARDDGFEHSLNGAGARACGMFLNLPAMQVCALVGDGQSEAGHAIQAAVASG